MVVVAAFCWEHAYLLQGQGHWKWNWLWMEPDTRNIVRKPVGMTTQNIKPELQRNTLDQHKFKCFTGPVKRFFFLLFILLLQLYNYLLVCDGLSYKISWKYMAVCRCGITKCAQVLMSGVDFKASLIENMLKETPSQSIPQWLLCSQSVRECGAVFGMCEHHAVWPWPCPRPAQIGCLF